MSIWIALNEYTSQSGLTTQIRTCPRAAQQGRLKCRCHVNVPAVPTQQSIQEEGRSLKQIYKSLNQLYNKQLWPKCSIILLCFIHPLETIITLHRSWNQNETVLVYKSAWFPWGTKKEQPNWKVLQWLILEGLDLVLFN